MAEWTVENSAHFNVALEKLESDLKARQDKLRADHWLPETDKAFWALDVKQFYVLKNRHRALAVANSISDLEYYFTDANGADYFCLKDRGDDSPWQAYYTVDGNSVLALGAYYLPWVTHDEILADLAAGFKAHLGSKGQKPKT